MNWDRQRPRDPQRQHGFDLIGWSIKRRRLSLHWTQRQLEVQAGIDQTVISRLENGRQYGLKWGRFADLVDALGGLDLPSGTFAPAGLPKPPTALDQAFAARTYDIADLPEDDDPLAGPDLPSGQTSGA